MNPNNPSEKTKLPLEEIFSFFYAKDSFRPVILKPFVFEDYTYATDTYSLIRCKTEKINFEYENNETISTVDKIFPIPNTSEIIDLDSIDWDSLMKEHECIGDGNDVECGNCNGEGTCEDTVYYKGRMYDYEFDCPVCEGSGYEEEEKQIPTGKKTFGVNDKVKIKDNYLNAKRFYILKKVKDLIGKDLELKYYNKSNNKFEGLLFKIDFLDILIMPLHLDYNEADDVIANII